MGAIFINLRCMQRNMTGVQRYTQEVTSRLQVDWKGITPEPSLGHIAGPLWDQSLLALRARSGLLWSPANTGPIFHPRHIVTVHDLAVLKDESWFSPAFQRYYAYVIPKLIKNAIQIITDSDFIRTEILSKFDLNEDKVETCQLGVSPKFFLEPDPDPENSYILAVGSLDPRKNLQRLFKAWRQVHLRFPGTELRIVGESGSIFKNMDSSIFEGSNIRLLGRISDTELLDQYRGATAFAYPSLYEGFGLPVLEAMAAGLPILTSERSAMSEITGDRAVLVDPLEEESISTGLVRILETEELRHSLSQSGKAIAQRFTWERTAESITRIITKHNNQ